MNGLSRWHRLGRLDCGFIMCGAGGRQKTEDREIHLSDLPHITSGVD